MVSLMEYLSLVQMRLPEKQEHKVSQMILNIRTILIIIF
jgi:hypothetical protein